MIRTIPTPPRPDNERLDEIISRMCDQYCKHPLRLLKQEELEYRCEHCPMQDLVDYVDELRGKFGC